MLHDPSLCNFDTLPLHDRVVDGQADHG